MLAVNEEIAVECTNLCVWSLLGHYDQARIREGNRNALVGFHQFHDPWREGGKLEPIHEMTRGDVPEQAREGDGLTAEQKEPFR